MTEGREDFPKVNNIVLIGFMAAGKSTVGKLLAKELGWTYLDTDAEIERVTELTIPEIFRKYGEKRFRAEENLLVQKLSGASNTVIATGGGTVLNPENWLNLEKLGLIVFLKVPLEIALTRAKNNQDRPLLNNNKAEIEQLWNERQHTYHQAQLVIDTSEKDFEMIVADILEYLKGGCGKNGTES